jgi:hypothetical protein
MGFSRNLILAKAESIKQSKAYFRRGGLGNKK